MNKVYRVVFLGLHQREKYFKSRISTLGVSTSAVDAMINKAPVVLKESESLEYARKYATAITRAGGRASISTFNAIDKEHDDCINIPTMSSFTQCPQCGHRQTKKELCERCSFALACITSG